MFFSFQPHRKKKRATFEHEREPSPLEHFQASPLVLHTTHSFRRKTHTHTTYHLFSCYPATKRFNFSALSCTWSTYFRVKLQGSEDPLDTYLSILSNARLTRRTINSRPGLQDCPALAESLHEGIVCGTPAAGFIGQQIFHRTLGRTKQDMQHDWDTEREGRCISAPQRRRQR